ncbi:SMP-30/gluconolactonase/LRE family protein [Streptomyces sp. NRAIS4]
MSRLTRLRLATGAATAVVAAVVLAASPASAGEPTASQPHIVAHFDLAAGQTPENIAVEPDGSADLTFAGARQVAHVTPDGHTTIRATLPDEPNANTPNLKAATVFGIARAHDGTLYVDYATGTDKTGIWRIAPDGGAPRQIAQLPATALPNGLALDERHGVLYAADSVQGVVWRVPQAGGAPTVWAKDTALTPVPVTGAGFGANGVKVHGGAVWVSNSDRGTLSRIPVRPNGSAGPVENRATGLDHIDDFTFATPYGDTVLAALIGDNELVEVHPDGTHTAVLTQADGLSNPTSVAVHDGTVYVDSAAYFTKQDPNLLLAHLSCELGH